MVVLIVVVVACFIVGSAASAQWLPALLDDGPVGLLVSFVVCGLFGAALATAGINVDLIVRELEHPILRDTSFEPEILARGLVEIFRDSGTLLALALVAYLLAPKARRRAPSAAEPAS